MIANQTATDAYLAAGDDTVRMRHLKNGDLQILSRDGKVILEQIPKAVLDRAAESTHNEPTAESRGFVVGMFLSSALWVGIFFICKWLAGA